jgi:sugar lactone lactonase YvrE
VTEADGGAAGNGRGSFAAAVASERSYNLAEGPLWDEERERVLWVDINAGDVHIGSVEEDAITPSGQLSFDETVGAVACSADGQLIVAGQRDLYRVERDGAREVLAAVVPADKNSRLNDGACDPASRYLVGSMSLDARKREECLYQIGHDHDVVIVDDDLTLSNGLGWSPDGQVLYSIDTIPGIIWARSYDVATGNAGVRIALVRLRDGFPDGLCVDTDGNLWVAIWGAGEVRCYTPMGEHRATVTVPAPHTSSVAFVGPARDALLITTGRDQLSSAQLEQFPLSGHLFIAHVQATGVRTAPWSAS